MWKKSTCIQPRILSNVIFCNTDHSLSSGGIFLLVTRPSSLIICQFTLPYPMFVKHSINSLLVASGPLFWRQISSAALQRSWLSSSSSWTLAITYCLIFNLLASFFYHEPVLSLSATAWSTPSVGGSIIRALAFKRWSPMCLVPSLFCKNSTIFSKHFCWSSGGRLARAL